MKAWLRTSLLYIINPNEGTLHVLHTPGSSWNWLDINRTIQKKSISIMSFITWLPVWGPWNVNLLFLLEWMVSFCWQK